MGGNRRDIGAWKRAILRNNLRGDGNQQHPVRKGDNGRHPPQTRGARIKYIQSNESKNNNEVNGVVFNAKQPELFPKKPREIPSKPNQTTNRVFFRKSKIFCGHFRTNFRLLAESKGADPLSCPAKGQIPLL